MTSAVLLSARSPTKRKDESWNFLPCFLLSSRCLVFPACYSKDPPGSRTLGHPPGESLCIPTRPRHPKVSKDPCGGRPPAVLSGTDPW